MEVKKAVVSICCLHYACTGNPMLRQTCIRSARSAALTDVSVLCLSSYCLMCVYAWSDLTVTFSEGNKAMENLRAAS